MNRRQYIVIIVSLLILSCKKSIEVDPPINPIVSEVVFSNDSSAISSLTGIYTDMMLIANGSTQFSASGITVFTGMYSDELRHFSVIFKPEFQRSSLTESSDKDLTDFLWDRAYRYIYTTNLCIEELNKTTKLTPSIKTKLLGEAKFIRAFCYFHLVNNFGGVPLPLNSDYRITMKLGRATEEEIYSQITADLQDAKTLLSADYDNSGRVRPIKWAATALLARVLLYRKNWSGAEAEASAVINTGPYELAGISDVFKKNSPETIWQLQPVNVNINTFEGALFIPTSTSPSASAGYFLTDSLVKAFENGDARRYKWVGARTYQVYPDSLYYPAKYKVRASIPASENYIVLRLAEQYLIRAEARINQNKLTEAQDDLNVIRTRAGLGPATATTMQEFISAIEHERRVELFAEWGNRWYDLKRTDRANSVLGVMKPATWKQTALLWPIPYSQIRANPALQQNPGY